MLRVLTIKATPDKKSCKSKSKKAHRENRQARRKGVDQILHHSADTTAVIGTDVVCAVRDRENREKNGNNKKKAYH